MIDKINDRPTTAHGEKIDPDAYLEFAKTLRGQPIKTQGTGKVFHVIVERGQMKFVPEATGKKRSTSFRKVLTNFEDIGSFTLKDYRGVTVNATYHLPIIAMYLLRKAT